MKKLIALFTVLALAGGLMYSCSKENVTPTQLEKSLKSASAYTNCNACIAPESGDVYTQTGSVSGPIGGNTKSLSYTAYNTQNDFVVVIQYVRTPSSSGASSTVQVTVNSSTLTAIIINNTSATFTFPLTSAWQPCDVVTWSFTETSGQSNEKLSYSGTYALVGICTTTTISGAPAEPVCLGTPVTLTGTVDGGANLSGGQIKIQELVGASYVDVAVANVTSSVKTVTFDATPSSAGTRTFRAFYSGAGSNGYKSSNSADITVTGKVCEVTCDESFSYSTADNMNVVFTYISPVAMSGAGVKFTLPHVTGYIANDGKTYSVNPGNSQGSPTVLTWTGDIQACVPITFSFTFSPDCSQNNAGFANVWTDFKVNEVSKKNAGTPTIKYKCN